MEDNFTLVPEPENPPVPPVEAPPKPDFAAGKKEILFGCLILLFAVLTVNFVLFGGFHLGFAISAPALILCSAGYLHCCGHRFDWYSGSLIVLSVIIAAGFGRSGDGTVKFYMLHFLVVAVNLALCLAAGQNRRSPGSVTSLLDAPRALFRLGFGKLAPSGKGVVEGVKNSGTAGRKVGAVGVGLLVSLPILIIMISLLMDADAAFEGLLKLLPENNIGEYITSGFFGALFGWILYSRAVALNRSFKPQNAVSREKKINTLTVNTVLTAACLVYCVYLFSQLAYLSGGLSGILPEEFTMAEYARRGFFEMSRLCMINLCLICVSVWLVKKETGISLYTRLCGTFLGLITLFLVATASAKMFMYIGSYGLTWNRVITEVVMLWMALTTVIVVLWLFLPRIPYMKIVMLSAMVMGAAVFWVDVDTVVARYNVEAYRSGRLESVDVDYLNTLSYSAVPYIELLTNDPDPEVAEQAKLVLSRKSCEIDDFRSWNYAKAQAKEILDPFQAEEESAVRGLLKEMTGLNYSGGTLYKFGEYRPRMIDGTRFIRIKCNLEEAEELDALLQEEGWSTLPLNKTLHDLLFARAEPLMEEFKGSYIYNTNTTGYWFFRNLHPETEDPTDPGSPIVDGYCRFVFCYYNADNRNLYIFECDRPLVIEEETN